MKRIDPGVLPFGDHLPCALLDSKGDVALAKDQIIEEIDLLLMRDRFAAGVFVPDDAPFPSLDEQSEAAPSLSQVEASAAAVSGPSGAGEEGGNETWVGDEGIMRMGGDMEGDAPVDFDLNRVAVDALRADMVLPRSIYDERGVMLLAAEQAITQDFLQRIRRRGIQYVYTRLPGDERPSGDARPSDGDAVVASLAGLHAGGASDRLATPELMEKAREGREAAGRWAGTLENMAQEVLQGRALSLDQTRRVLREIGSFVSADPALAALLINASQEGHEYLFVHSVHVALLAMALARESGLGQEDVVRLGLSGLFQDLGMLRVPGEIRFAPRKLDENERSIIERHPGYTVNLLEKHGVSDRKVLNICYQSHERCDRSGYPRRHHRMYIHPFARLLAVADVFAAATCPRPYRQPLSPFSAMALLLDEVKRQRLDGEVVKSFLDIVSLFPIGSYVKLSSGATARVIRANGGKHTRPVVVPLRPDGTETGKELDLLRFEDIKVVEALSGPPHSKAA